MKTNQMKTNQMKTNQMKIRLLKDFFTICILLLFLSCSEESIEPENQIDELKGISLAKANLPETAGFGYSPLYDRVFRTAFDQEYIIEQFVNSTKPRVDFFSAETANDFLRKTNVSFEVKADFTMAELLSVGGDFSGNFTREINIDSKHVSTVARINSERYRYRVEDGAKLKDDALKLIQDRDFQTFFERYGTMYTKEILRGGASYHVYTLDLTKMKNKSVTEIKLGLKSKIEKVFDVSASGSVTTTIEESISNQNIDAKVFSNLQGFAANIVQTPADVNTNHNQMISFLNNNRREAFPLKIKLAPYAELINDPELKEAFEIELMRYQNLQGWVEIKNRLNFIVASTGVKSLKSDANNLLTVVNDNINKAKNGAKLVPLKPNFGNEIFAIWDNLRPLYRYWNERVKDHFYTTNYSEIGDERSGYILQGVEAYVFEVSVLSNTVPLYRYWNERIKDHFYTMDYDELKNGRDGFEIQSNARMFAFKTKEKYTTQLYRYWNEEVKDHFYTTDYSEIGKARAGYRLQNSLSKQIYVYPSEIK